MAKADPYVSLVVRNFNGLSFLQQYLSSVVDAAEASVHATEVIVVDDGSTDDSVAYIKEHWPQVHIVVMPHNTGHAPAANKAILESRGELVVALDNDVRLDINAVDPLIRHFQDDRVFAVNSKIIVPRLGDVNESVKVAKLHHGMLYFNCVADPPDVPIPILYATACSVAYRKSVFAELGGFDTLYPPLYWDDTDLSYRARKRGYEILYEPASIAEHWYGGSTAPDRKRHVNRRKWENYFLFIWKNFTDRGLSARHFAWLPFVLAKSVLNGDRDMLPGFGAALKQFRKARRARALEIAAERVGDVEILRRFSVPPVAEFECGCKGTGEDGS